MYKQSKRGLVSWEEVRFPFPRGSCCLPGTLPESVDPYSQIFLIQMRILFYVVVNNSFYLIFPRNLSPRVHAGRSPVHLHCHTAQGRARQPNLALPRGVRLQSQVRENPVQTGLYNEGRFLAPETGKSRGGVSFGVGLIQVAQQRQQDLVSFILSAAEAERGQTHHRQPGSSL